MHLQRCAARVLALSAALACMAASQASITVYTSQASFLAAIASPSVDTFDDLLAGTIPSSPLHRSIPGYSYTATEGPNYPYFNTIPPGANKWLPAGDIFDTVTFASFTGGPQAIGGNFFDTRYQSLLGVPTQGPVSITVFDSLGATTTQTVLDATQTTFLGFLSDGTITSLAMMSDGTLSASVDNLTFAAQAVPVPEASTFAMLLTGIGSLGVMLRRGARQSR
jgi:hypothetical protein